MSNRDPYSDSPEPWLVRTTKVYSGVGADIVMESISPVIQFWFKTVSFRRETKHLCKRPICRGLSVPK
jgi:hypothetical protein